MNDVITTPQLPTHFDPLLLFVFLGYFLYYYFISTLYYYCFFFFFVVSPTLDVVVGEIFNFCSSVFHSSLLLFSNSPTTTNHQQLQQPNWIDQFAAASSVVWVGTGLGVSPSICSRWLIILCSYVVVVVVVFLIKYK